MKIVNMGSGEKYLLIERSGYEITQMEEWANAVMGRSSIDSTDFYYARAVAITLHWIMGYADVSPARLLS